jgi:hypothetical protein
MLSRHVRGQSLKARTEDTICRRAWRRLSGRRGQDFAAVVVVTAPLAGEVGVLTAGLAWDVVVTALLAGVFGVDPTVSFQPQVVVISKLYFPEPVIGLCPPPPSPVWLVNLTGVFPFLLLVSANVPVVAGV